MDVSTYLRENEGRFVAELCECCRFASVSALGSPDIGRNRDWISARLEGLGASVTHLPTSGQDAIVGLFRGGSRRRLLLYSHYDVQPTEPDDLWDAAPFSPQLRNGRVYARGVSDDKSDVMARMHAIETWLACIGDLPFDLVYLCEGEEEVGSPNLAKLVEDHSELLKADGCLWESTALSSSGEAQLFAGVRGALFVELEVRLLDTDVHSGYASIYENAASVLVSALASLKDLSGRVSINGFYDGVRDPSPDDKSLMDRVLVDKESLLASVGARRLVAGTSGQSISEQLLFNPTANIAGLSAGYFGQGPKAIVPAVALAKMDFRLVPDQMPDDILVKLKRHLAECGFGDVQVKTISQVPPARSQLNSTVVTAAVSASDRVYGSTILLPFMPATGPLYPFVARLGVPTVLSAGAGRPDSRVHAVNENILVTDYLKSIEYNVQLFKELQVAWGTSAATG